MRRWSMAKGVLGFGGIDPLAAESLGRGSPVLESEYPMRALLALFSLLVTACGGAPWNPQVSVAATYINAATPYTQVVSTWVIPSDGKGAPDSLVARTCLGNAGCQYHNVGPAGVRDTTVFLNQPPAGYSMTGHVQVKSYRRATSDSASVTFGPITNLDAVVPKVTGLSTTGVFFP